ncbi:MAG: hypothetical protein IIY70_01625 [Oscillospiraceae bacterium]|nr:hypothetical protein [Oscillospiraceae bacterium]
MDGLADIHSHILCDVDDGAKDQEGMLAIVQMAYRNGTRFLCATPHYHPGFFGENGQKSLRVFETLKAAVSSQCPELRLALGNELRYGPAAVEWLEKGACRTLNGTNYVLVDFLQNEGTEKIIEAMHRLMNAGYRPILAHAERYEKFGRDWKSIAQIREMGVRIQLDAASIFGGWDWHSKHMSRSLLKHHVVDYIASDAHDVDHRNPDLSKAFTFVSDRYGIHFAEKLFSRNALEEIF